MSNDPTQFIPQNATVSMNTAADPNRTQAATYATQSGSAATILGQPPVFAQQTDGVAFTASVGNRFALASGRTREHIVTRITAGQGVSGGQRMPVNVALVIDRSGSMEGAPLDYVKRACSYVVDLLTPNDVLSIITFEETVETLMPARRVTDPALIKAHIARITAGNTTNLFDGLYAGGAQIASVPNQGYVSRVLLLTDGEPTAGLRDFQSIVNQAVELKNKGISVTALGFGPEYNEELMAALARRSGGNYYFIQQPEQIPDVFRREMETVLGVSIRNPRLTLQIPRAVSVRQVYGSLPNYAPNQAEILLPDIERGSTVTKVWEVEYEPHTPGTYRTAKAVLNWDTANGQAESRSANAVIEFVGDKNQVASGADAAVQQEIQVAQMSRNLEATMIGLQTQQLNVTQAADALNKTQTILQQQGRTEEAQQVAQAAQSLRRGEESGAEKTLIGTIYNLDMGKRK